MNKIDGLLTNPIGAAAGMALEPEIGLWDYSPGCSWAMEIRELLNHCGGLSPRVHVMVLGGQTAEGAKFLVNADLQVVTISPDHVGRGTAAVQKLHQKATRCPIVAVVEAESENSFVGLTEAGASDFLSPPLRRLEVLARVFRFLRQPCRQEFGRQCELNCCEIVGQSKAIRSQMEQATDCANCDATVLIYGETGTGKELFARMIHDVGERSTGPFVAINCGALPLEIAESQLFGHERGAFTGASGRHNGFIEQARGGTLFLDEIDSLPMPIQCKLLRVLQDGVYQPVGAEHSLKADVRIISATNSDIETLIRAGRFRRDLYYRLNVLSLGLPPLRERREDIPLLAEHLLRVYCREARSESKELSPAAMKKLEAHDWPGNVRELGNVIHRAVVHSRSSIIDACDVVVPASRFTEKLSGRVCSDAKIVVVGEHGRGRPRKRVTEDLLAILGKQKLGGPEWFRQAQQGGMDISVRTFQRRRQNLESNRRIVGLLDGTYQRS